MKMILVFYNIYISVVVQCGVWCVCVFFLCFGKMILINDTEKLSRFFSYSTVTLLARLRGWSMLHPRRSAI